MKKDKLIFPIIILLILSSCVTTGKQLPAWAEIKPQNTEKEIFFVYGPINSRDGAKKGLYKEISEYFGVKVSSVDKFVKNVTFENGETDINQTKESQVDVTSREKGLNSIEIREIWSDEVTNRWCILASIDADSEKAIREQVATDIENERLQGVLKQGEAYVKEAESVYNELQKKMSELDKLKIRMSQTIERVSGIADNMDIMTESQDGLSYGDQIAEVVKEIKNLNNQIKIISKKNELLINQIGDSEITGIELDFFIRQNADLLIKSENHIIETTKSQLDIDVLNGELNRILLKSELDLLGDEENLKRDLKFDIKNIGSNYITIQSIRDETELLFNQSEDLLRKIKQVVYSESIGESEQKLEAQKLLLELENRVNSTRESVDTGFKLKSDIGIKFNISIKSPLITDIEKKDITSIYNRVDSPISWIEIYKDKILVLYNNGKNIVDDLLVEDLIDIRLEEFTTNLLEKTAENIDLTIGEFTIEDSTISSSFSKFLKGKLFTAIAGRGTAQIVDYKSVTDYLTSLNINPNIIYDGTNDTAPIVQHVIYGDYWINGGDIELKINLKNISSNRVLYSESIMLPKKSLPIGVDLRPKNFNQIVSLDKKLRDGSITKGFDIWPDRGNGSIYKDGENMVVNIISPLTGFVKIYHISAENELTLIFPNKYDKNNNFIAGTHYTIGDSSYPFNFKLGKPYGTESLRAIFSTTQFDDLVNDVYNDDFLYSGIRGVNIERRINNDININSTVATSYYTITE